ncbi:MAG: KH domain-containing protein [Coriobacteriia bacterium]|nr:KH domain-containing protein [Coriobacteriia bacterium]
MDRQTECIAVANTIEEAVDVALEELGVQQDAIRYEVLPDLHPSETDSVAAGPVRVRAWLLDAPVAEEDAFLNGGDNDDDEEEDANLKQVVDGFNAEAELSDEQFGLIADAAAASLKTIVSAFGIDDPVIEEYEGDEGEIILDVVGADLGLLIGRHGKTLDALQTLVAAITVKQAGLKHPLVVDIEGYRHRRKQKVEEIAHRAADRAVRQRSSVKLRPMTAYERRIVHVALRNDSRVSTCSEGTEPYRQVVVKSK